jgi:hypothetical protein
MPMRDGRRVRFVTLIGVLAACSWLVQDSALASFPGSDGAVAYGGFDGTDDEIDPGSQLEDPRPLGGRSLLRGQVLVT